MRISVTRGAEELQNTQYLEQCHPSADTMMVPERDVVRYRCSTVFLKKYGLR